MQDSIVAEHNPLILLYIGAQGRGLCSLHKKQLAPVSTFYFVLLHIQSLPKPSNFSSRTRSSRFAYAQDIGVPPRNLKAAMKQKIVIKVQMANGKCRSKVMALVAATCGVDSVALAGDGKDQVVVVGDGVDSVKLTSELRKKFGHAQLVEVGEAKEEEKKKPEVPVIEYPCYPYYHYPALANVVYEYPAAGYGYCYPY